MKIKTLILTGIFAALIAVCSQIMIPMPFGVPITLQTFAVVLAAYMLGRKNACVCLAVYCLLGIAGLPVFSGFGAGILKLIGPTGGFIIGFFPLVLFCSAKNWVYALFGILMCHFFGVAQFSFVTGNTIAASFYAASLWFLPKDIIFSAGAYFLQKKLKKVI